MTRATLILLVVHSLVPFAYSATTYFEEHRDPAAPEVRFIHRTPQGLLGLGLSRAYLAPSALSAATAIELSFPGARSVPPQQEQLTVARTHILRGSDPTKWTHNLTNSESVRYPQLYPGIDLLFHARTQLLEYDFELAPRADPSLIRLHFAHAKPRLASTGELIVGDLYQRPPVAFQTIAGRRVPVPARWQLNGQTATFVLGTYNPAYPLIIDPVVTYSTYFGGDRVDAPTSAAVDAAKNLYIAGGTNSANFRTTAGVVQATGRGSTDAYIAKFSPTGQLLFSTLIGGGGADTITDIAITPQGAVAFGGLTTSPDYPLRNPRQTEFKGGPPLGSDAIIGILDPSGASLLFSTLWGGSLEDRVTKLALDPAGNIYVAGITYSLDLFTNAGQRTNRGGNFTGFVSKFTPTGSNILYSTYLGGTAADSLFAIAVDATGAMYLAGTTASFDYPITQGALQTNYKGALFSGEAFLTKLTPNGEGIAYSTFFGGTSTDAIRAITVDAEGNVYAVGETTSGDLAVTPNAVQRERGGNQDGFFIKVNPTGTQLLTATYLGGAGLDALEQVRLAPDGSVYVVGRTESPNITTRNPIQPGGYGGARDGYFAQLNGAGTSIIQASYLGGSGLDEFVACPVDSASTVYLVGSTASTNLPVSPGAAQPTFGGGQFDAAIIAVADPDAVGPLTITPDRLAFSSGPGGPAQRQSITLRVNLGQPAWTVTASPAWLTVDPASGRGAGIINVTATPGALTIGDYAGAITITNTSLGVATRIPVSLAVSALTPAVTSAGVVHAASYQTGAVSPGQIITIFGSNLGPTALVGAQLDSRGRLANQLAGVRVLFDFDPAPLVYVSANQVSVIVPYAASGRTTTRVEVEFNGGRSIPVNLPVVPAKPALFTADSSGRGLAAALNQSGSVNTAANPANPGDIVVFYGTGEGLTNPANFDGAISTAVNTLRLPVTVRIGGLPAEVVYAGSAPGLVAGVFQLNVRLPDELPVGNQPVEITVGTATSPTGVTVAVALSSPI